MVESLHERDVPEMKLFQSRYYTNLKLPVMLYDHHTFLIVPCCADIWTKVVQQSILKVLIQNYEGSETDIVLFLDE